MKVAFATLALALTTAACQSPSASTAPTRTTEEDPCMAQGYAVGSGPYIACLGREADARRAGSGTQPSR